MPNSWYPKPRYNQNRNLTNWSRSGSEHSFVFRNKLLIQIISVLLIFFFSWGLFQLEGPMVNNLQRAVRAWFTKDTDLQPVFNVLKRIGLGDNSFDRAGYQVFAPLPIGSLGSMTIPVSGTITRPFGWIMVEGKSAFHDGLLIEAPLNTPVKAAYAGTVLEIGENEKLGRYLIISHREGLLTVYGYCQEILVQEDEKVEKAQIIARVGGQTGAETGQLYFETGRLGEPINPMDLLEKKNPEI